MSKEFKADTESAEEFTLALVHEDTPTIDGRVFAKDSVDWREPPLTLMYLTENTHDGHKGSVAGGVITRIWRDGSTVFGAGRFDTGEAGQTLKSLIEQGVLNGVSSDVGGAVSEEELGEDGFQQERITEGRIMGATVLPFPAFDDTRISLVAAGVPDRPPASWFSDPTLTQPTALSVTDEGKVYGHAALWGTCHIAHKDKCVTPPRSRENYSLFLTGEVHTDENTAVPVGAITLGTGHAKLSFGASNAAEHYDNTGTVVADVSVGEDSHGIWVSGALRPDVTEQKLRSLRAAALSGDWRQDVKGHNLELVALLAVNTPGFPVPRPRVSLAVEDKRELALVAAGVVDLTSVEANSDCCEPCAKSSNKDDFANLMKTSVSLVSSKSAKEEARLARKNQQRLASVARIAKKEELKVTDLNKRVEALELAIKALASSQFSAPDGHPFYGNQYTDGSGGGSKDEGKSGDKAGKADKSEVKPDVNKAAFGSKELQRSADLYVAKDLRYGDEETIAVADKIKAREKLLPEDVEVLRSQIADVVGGMGSAQSGMSPGGEVSVKGYAHYISVALRNGIDVKDETYTNSSDVYKTAADEARSGREAERADSAARDFEDDARRRAAGGNI